MATVPKFDQVKVGDAIKPIVLPPISRHQLALYCGGSGDHNPIHVDLDFAKKFGFKDVFAHGMLSMGFLGRLVTSYAPRDNYCNSCSSPPLGGEARRGASKARATPSPNLSPCRGRGA